MAGRRPDAAPRAGRHVRAGPDRVAARLRFACLGSARAPAGHDHRDGRGRAAGGRGRASLRRADGGWRPVAAATTPIGSCRGRGAWSGWPARTARSRRRPPSAWRERWAAEAARYGQAPLPSTFDDAPNAGLPLDAGQLAAEERSRVTAALARRLAVPRLVREAVRPRLVATDGRGRGGAARAGHGDGGARTRQPDHPRRASSRTSGLGSRCCRGLWPRPILRQRMAWSSPRSATARR